MPTSHAHKEHPILFSGPMVNAILDGRKTQTRRVVKPVRGFEHHNICKPDMAADPWSVWWHGDQADRVGCLQECPYGKTGGRLWVRETFYIDRIPFDKGRLPKEKPVESHPTYKLSDATYYRADGECCEQIPECCCGEVGPVKWRPSIFMPRWASRITLEITDVRVERLQEISDADAIAEGIEHIPSGTHLWRCYENGLHHPDWVREPRLSFASLWRKINGPAPWSENPWVWVITFRRIGQ